MRIARCTAAAGRCRHAAAAAATSSLTAIRRGGSASHELDVFAMAGPPVGDRSLARLKKPPDRLEALSTGMEAFSRGARVSAVQLLGRPLRDAAAASLDKILEVRGPAQCKAGFGQGCVPARRR